MKNSTLLVSGGALAAVALDIAPLAFQEIGQINLNPATGAREAATIIKPRSSANALRSKLMIEAHARAKVDCADELACRGRAHHVDRPYSYYLGLQMRSGFAEARVARTGMAPAFELPAQRWA